MQWKFAALPKEVRRREAKA